MRVVVDTNVLISRFLSPSGPPARIFEEWQLQRFELVVSEPILEEYQKALLYEHVAARHGMTPSEVAEVMDDLRQFALVMEPQEKATIITEDPADNKFLECAVAGAAEFIISGDAHLLNLQDYQGIQIFSPTAFLAMLEQTRGGEQ